VSICASVAQTNDEPAEAIRGVNALWRSSIAAWTALASSPATGDSIPEATLRKLFDPLQWAQVGGGEFDRGLDRLIEGAGSTTRSAFNQKVAIAQQLWLARHRDIAAYRAVVQKAWRAAFDQFARELAGADGDPIRTWRELADRWIRGANDALLQMQRTPEFLDAQRAMTRSAMDYRLQERAVAEALCDALHVPTRTEIDELQRTVCELRRELRALQRRVSDPPKSSTRAAPRVGPAKSAASGR
jgi:hypothetical protein